MGGNISIKNIRDNCGEQICDIYAQYTENIKGINISSDIINITFNKSDKNIRISFFQEHNYFTKEEPTEEQLKDNYYNSQGNIILIESFSGTTPTNLTLQNSTSFTYDTKKNPWYKFFNEDMGNPNMFPICFYDSNKITGDFGQLATNRILYICPNNILTKNTTSYPAGTTNTSNYSYTYNDEDYPITKEVSSSSTTQYFSFTYN